MSNIITKEDLQSLKNALKAPTVEELKAEGIDILTDEEFIEILKSVTFDPENLIEGKK